MVTVIPTGGPRTVGGMAGRSKSLPADQMARVRGLVRELVDTRFAGNISRAAKETKVAYAQLYGLYEGSGGAGNLTLQRLADFTGRSADELMGRSEPARTGDPARPVLRNRPGYNEALALAEKQAWWVPPSVWPMAGETATLIAPAYITPEMLIHAAQLVMSTATAGALEGAGREQAEAELADIEARQIEAQRIVREAKARGETPPSVAKVMQRLRADGDKRRIEEARAKDAAKESK